MIGRGILTGIEDSPRICPKGIIDANRGTDRPIVENSLLHTLDRRIIHILPDITPVMNNIGMCMFAIAVAFRLQIREVGLGDGPETAAFARFPLMVIMGVIAAVTSIIIGVAVDKPLFGKIDGYAESYLDGRLQGRDSGKSPATSATSLVFDRRAAVFIPPVEAVRQGAGGGTGIMRRHILPVGRHFQSA